MRSKKSSVSTPLLIVIGVSGCGKSTIGAGLARQLGWQFADADDFHPPANVEKMRTGSALNDDDRWPWLDRLNQIMRESQTAHQPMVLACSALKQRYRDRLSKELADLRWIHLAGTFELISARMALRQHKYMPASLLRSQFEALEPPIDALTVAIGEPPEQLIQRIIAELKL
jgi:gluconokinase